jgi:hypothetical protein
MTIHVDTRPSVTILSGTPLTTTRISTEDQGKGLSIPTQLEFSRKLVDYEGCKTRLRR